MNRCAFEKLTQPESVVMLFDPETDTAGLRPASPLMPNAYPVRLKGKWGTRLISAKSFAEKYEIKLDNTVRFLTAAIEDGILILEFRHMSSAARKQKKARRW